MAEMQQSQITEMPFPDCVRIRKGMYISNLNQMVTEIIDNSVDEHFAKRCFTIAVVIQDGVFTIQDDGSGIPITPSKNDPTKTQVEVAFTKLHAGGKFGTSDGYAKKTGGMNGVGGSCVQALSSSMSVFVTTKGKKYQTDFSKGYVIEKTKVIEENVDPNLHGTVVSFVPDAEIWKDADPIDYKTLQKRIKQIAFLNPGLTMYYYVEDSERNVKIEETYVYSGINQYVEELSSKKSKRLTDILMLDTTSKDDIDIKVGLTYVDNYSLEIYSFCNNMLTTDMGDHEKGFIEGLNSAVNKYLELYNKKLIFKTEDLKEGLIAVVSVRVADPNFEGQAKTKLKMPSVKIAVKEAIFNVFLDYLDKNPETAKIIIDKIDKAARAREAAKKARDLQRKSKSITESGNPTKLADCSSKNPEECEIYLVEGDSAGGSAKQGRNRQTQAVLPVTGKIMNVEKQRADTVYSNVKLKEIPKALKCGIGEELDIDKLRYHKIIIMSDADVDGSHIQCLHVTYLYKYFRPLIEQGYVYFACPPLFKLTYNKKMEGLNKDNEIYAYTDQHLQELINEFGQPKNIQRYKGLGEMDADQLWETTMNPETRILQQISIEDAEAAAEIISLCMNNDTIAQRREWIMENYQLADIDC